MTFPILVTHANGTFTASAFGSPSVTAAGATKEAAVAAVTAQLRAGEAEVVFVDVDAPSAEPITDTATAWRELCADVYRERDAQKATEFPE